MPRPSANTRAGHGVLALFVALGALVSCPHVALAGGKSVAVLVEGPDAEVVHKAIEAAIPPGTGIVEAGALKSALIQQGVWGPFGKTLEGEAREKTLSRVRRAVGAAGVDAALIAQVVRVRRTRRVRLSLVATSGAAGDLEEEVVLSAKQSKDDDAKLAASVGTALVDYRAAPSPPSGIDDSDKGRGRRRRVGGSAGARSSLLVRP
jgi:hypothetical protein